MFELKDLYEMKSEFEKEKAFVEAEISVVNKMIAKEEAKSVETTEAEVETVSQTDGDY